MGVSKDASRVPFSCKRRGYKDIPRGPTLKVERSGRGLKSLFDQVSSGMVATRRHWVHVQTVEEEKRKRRRRKK